jgi:hypothetical protein
MATGRGYLGKISAVVSANTGNYVRGLNDSAKKTQAFANSITQDLRRASADVSKSINSILTPIQRYERAIQNAASQKLAFRGFQGAIRSVEDLNARVRELVALGRQAEVDLVVRESGLRNITELRNVLGTLTQQDVDLAVNVGGVEGLRRLRADVQEVDGKVINVKTRIEASALDRLIDTFSRISPERLKRLQVRVETRELERAIIQSDRLVSITNELGNPLGAAVAKYASLSAEIQTAFGPALQRAQRGVENLTTSAERGAEISTQRYAGVRRAVEAVTASIERLSTVQNLANSGFTGRELEFAAPTVRDELTRSAQLSQRAAALPPAVLEDGSVRQRVEELARLRQEIARYQASVERRTTLGLDTTEARARLSAVVSQSELARASLEDLIRAAGSSGLREVSGIADSYGRAKASFAALSGELQTALGPAFLAAGATVERFLQSVERSADVSEKDFARVASAAKSAEAAIGLFAEAQSRVSSLRTGNELAFQAPALDSVLSRAAAAGEGAASLSDSRRARGDIGELVSEINRLAQQAVVAEARVKAAASPESFAAARIEADRFRTELAAAVELLEGELPVKVDADAAIRDIQRLKQELQGISDDANFTITGNFQNLDQAKSAIREIVSSLDKLGAQQAAGLQGQLGNVIAAAELGDLTLFQEEYAKLKRAFDQELEIKVDADEATAKFVETRKAFQDLVKSVNNSARSAISGGLAQTTAGAASEFDALAARIAKLGIEDRVDLTPLVAQFTSGVRAGRPLAELLQTLLTLSEKVGNSERRGPRGRGFLPASADGTVGERSQLPANFGRNRLLGSIGGEIDVVRRRIEELPGVTAQIGPEVDRLTARFRNLASSGVGFTSEQAQRLRDEVAAVNSSLNARQSQARQLESSFGGAGRAGINLGIDERSVRGIAAQFEFLQGRLAGVSAQARGPLVSAMQRYRQVAVQAFRDGSISTEQGQRRLENYRNEVVRVGAAILNVKPARLAGQLQRVGDVARGSFGNAGLAIQQAAFAIDDFFSVTGGLDQRIRAAGNNISQLGFILGGTAGLIAGISLSIGSQLVAALVRWYTEADQAEAATKRLNAALEQQKSKTEELAASYNQLADAIQEAGLSERDREARRRQQPIDEIRGQQAERRRAIAAANAPQTGASQARIDAIDKELEQEENLLRRRQLLAERRREQAMVDSELNLIERQAAGFAATAVKFQPGLPAATRSLERARTDTQRDLARAERRGDEPAIERLTRQLASLEVAIQDLRDRQTLRGFDRQQQISDSFARSQSALSGVEGFRFADFISAQLQDRARSAFDRLSAGQIDATDYEIATRAIVLWGERVESASNQVAAFAEAIDRAATDLAKAVEGDLVQRSDSLRRQANAAEAQFGASDPRTVMLRSQQDSVEDASRAATRNRQGIESELSQRRRRFEESALLGSGNPEAAVIGNRIAELQRLVSTPATDQAGANDRENARLEIEQLRVRLAELFDALPEVQALRRRADEGDIAAQRQIQEIESQARGRELSLTPAQRASEELNAKIQDIRNFFSLAAENSTGLPDDVEKIRGQMNAAIDQTTVDAARQAAPAIFSLGEEVQNAILQGPSRASLGATDASTIEGQRELNRLLRGDDQARDVNLVELQNQTRLLGEIAQNTRENAPVAI